ncbi:MBOAT family O-acyltransferase [Williamwhitmania taraxaci]|uniref:D-alanyl-lipoteichoic acid acyltransferase DltB, MBOAT superfamily n=1 Tax=Williamwhitmania taraxaci TaxID=1640674 RepID=A0A1G6I3Q2_9BACT|nr:MBOAT family O-acyltransferase [Williamwhitmania taraxaci]SDC01172.1 D-alanyl-lipoteichoic acid acyltransferase DltB, MBOAT superfamily [Williamwhitmania taraxaci]
MELAIKEYIKRFFLFSQTEPMLFSGITFWIFLLILLLGFHFVYKKNQLRNIYLFAFSLFFYYKSGGFFFWLLIFSTVVDYLLGLGIGSAQKKLARRAMLAISVTVNLGVLSYFKYAYFFTETINNWFGTHLKVSNLLAEWSNHLTGSTFDVTAIILPVGISFYTFQTISYTIDVYRRHVTPVRNILNFGFYVSFFPQLVAGPIVRASEFIPQLYIRYYLTKDEVGHAIFLILVGLLKKVAISNYIASNFVDRVFDSPIAYSGFEVLMGIYGYALQIYCDFSGYTDIALGVALLLGFRLPVNFNSPYKATSITNFWHRWHISLSRWLRDYLYIPLGGSKKGKIRTYINLMITMLLGGLWHGASLKFVAWGGIHGLGLAIERLFGIGKHQPSKRLSPVRRFVAIVITFHIVCLAWIPFRAASFSDALTILSRIATAFSWNTIPEVLLGYKAVFITIAIGFAAHWFPSQNKENFRGWFISTNPVIKLLAILLVVMLLAQVRTAGIQPFIYFQF